MSICSCKAADYNLKIHHPDCPCYIPCDKEHTQIYVANHVVNWGEWRAFKIGTTVAQVINSYLDMRGMKSSDYYCKMGARNLSFRSRIKVPNEYVLSSQDNLAFLGIYSTYMSIH